MHRPESGRHAVEAPVGPFPGAGEATGRGRELPVRVVAGVEADPDLFEIVCALGSCGRFTNLLNSGQKQPDQDRDDRDHDK